MMVRITFSVPKILFIAFCALQTLNTQATSSITPSARNRTFTLLTGLHYKYLDPKNVIRSFVPTLARGLITHHLKPSSRMGYGLLGFLDITSHIAYHHLAGKTLIDAAKAGGLSFIYSPSAFALLRNVTIPIIGGAGSLVSTFATVRRTQAVLKKVEDECKALGIPTGIAFASVPHTAEHFAIQSIPEHIFNGAVALIELITASKNDPHLHINIPQLIAWRLIVEGVLFQVCKQLFFKKTIIPPATFASLSKPLRSELEAIAVQETLNVAQAALKTVLLSLPTQSNKKTLALGLENTAFILKALCERSDSLKKWGIRIEGD